MQLELCWIGKTKDAAIDALTREYVERIRRYLPIEACALRDEAALLKRSESERPRPQLILLDARGRQYTSEEFADFLRNHQERATRKLIFAIGPADGWSEAFRAHAQLLSLGKMTLAHELARVVVLEQLYRALTINAGHPYHLGHK